MFKFTAAMGVAAALEGAAAKQTWVTSGKPDDACHPRSTITWDMTYPPCLSQCEIEGKCAPPSEDVAGWTFQRDCICKGSFFDDAVGCNACKEANAELGHKEKQSWDSIFGAIQAGFCQDATPATNFGAHWTSALAVKGSPVAIPGDVRSRALKPGDTIVEHYYSATRSQGPGLMRPTTMATAMTTVSSAIESTNISAAAGVYLYAAATIHQQVAVVTALPAVPSGPKFRTNTEPLKVETNVTVSFGLATAPCSAVFIDGHVESSCEPMKLQPGSEAMVSPAAQPGAVDFSACTCANEFLAPMKLRPAPEAPAPEKCEGECDDHKAPPQPHKQSVDCIMKPGAKGAYSHAGGKPDADKGQPAAHVESNAVDEPADGVEPATGDKPAADGKPADGVEPVTGGKLVPEDEGDDNVEPVAPADNKAAGPAAGSPVDFADGSAPADSVTSRVDSAAKGASSAQGVAPVGTGAPHKAPAGAVKQTVTAGAEYKGVSAAVMAVAFAVYVM